MHLTDKQGERERVRNIERGRDRETLLKANKPKALRRSISPKIVHTEESSHICTYMCVSVCVCVTVVYSASVANLAAFKMRLAIS